MNYLFSLLLFIINFLQVYSQNWFRYPKISPDGSKIAFCYKGDIYVVYTEGGEAKPIVFTDAYETMPVWSHDGKYLAFAADRYGNFDVYVVAVNGGEAKRLTYHSANDFPYCFHPDNQSVYFGSTRTDDPQNRQYPYRLFNELYQVPIQGGIARMVLTTPAQDVNISSNGKYLLFHDVKGYEDLWRKHHTSSVTRDIWLYDLENKEHKQLTNYEGEDRTPFFAPNQKDFYFLSEKNGSYNVFKSNIEKPANVQAITQFKDHPVRFLSVARNGTLCYGYHGEIYIQKEGQEPKKLNVYINNELKIIGKRFLTLSDGITEFAVSPNQKEVVFVNRGDIFVANVEGSQVKQLTFTPYQERSVSFSPDGKKILYAAEEGNSWKIFTLEITNSKELYFLTAFSLKQETIVANEKENFQPAFSPDGNEIAFLEDRTTLKVINLTTKQVRTILSAEWNYSYVDGDQYYEWSPDGKWFLVKFNPKNVWISEIGLIPSDGNGKLLNISTNGYDDYLPKFHWNGKAVLWFSNRHGMRSHGSWGSQSDIYACFLSKATYDQFLLSKDDFALWKDENPEAYKKDTTDRTVFIDYSDFPNLKIRLSPFSSFLADAVWSKDYEKLYFVTKTESKFDLYVHKFREKETKVLCKLNAENAGNLIPSKDFKYLFVLADGKILKIDIEKAESKTLSTTVEWEYDYEAEKKYLFEHQWRQVIKKFYRKDLHQVRWDFYKKEYEAVLPHIQNNYDFAELCSELLGELNASHTGCRYYPSFSNPDQTASLGVFYDWNYTGIGIKIKDFIPKNPIQQNPNSLIDRGSIIESIDNQLIDGKIDFYAYLNKKAGKWVLLKGKNSKGQIFEEKVKPISLAEEAELLYQRWVEMNRQEVDSLSGGKVGYAHVRAMNDAAFREFYEQVLGKHYDKKALIVDTRFNGGGWLHDDLCTFLSGKKYVEFEPRDQKIGYEPQRKWIYPSCVLISEGNYSDAHFFPYSYKALGIGKLIGMPVPGTATAVWWEKMIDPTLVFGIPQVGVKTLEGQFLENNQLNPDIKVFNDYDNVANGKDFQLERAVMEMLKIISTSK